MEYIQCTSCGKKYGVNDKVRANIGRKIKCTACNEKFPIDIQQNKAKPIDEKTSKQTKEEPSTNQSKTEILKDDKSTTKLPDSLNKNRLQLYLSIGLISCLVAGIVVLQMVGPQVIKTPDIEEKKAKKIQIEQKGPVKKTKPLEQASQACKQAAAGQWLLDLKMIHTVYSNEEYLELLDQAQLQSEKVRRSCKDNTIIHHVLQAAREHKQPLWLIDEIKKLEYKSLNLVFPHKNELITPNK